MKSRGAWVLGTSIALVTAGISAPVNLAASAAVPAWTLQKVINPTSPSGEFAAVSCTSATSCVGVGTSGAAGAESLSAVWNGKHWTLVMLASPSGTNSFALDSVSCASATACMAVGESYAGNFSNDLPLAEQWNGTRWTLATTPTSPSGSTADLSSIACSSPTDCVAVGSYEDSGGNQDLLAESWNGTAWSLQTVTTPAGSSFPVLASVSCTSTSACTAVGSYEGASNEVLFAERWDGTTWSLQSLPSPAGSTFGRVSGVSCAAANACTAVGSYQDSASDDLPLAESWNGTIWSVMTVPNPSGSSETELLNISCSAATICIAIGDTVSSRQSPLAMGLSGTTWSVQAVPDPSGSTQALLDGISCSSKVSCVAVGETGGSSTDTLADMWSGAKWSIQTTPTPKAPIGALASVACTSKTACIAVGIGNGLLAEHWNGTKWAQEKTSTPKSWLSPAFQSVSCMTATACFGVGGFNSEAIPIALRPDIRNGGTTAGVPFVDRLSGTTWKATALPVKSVQADLSSIACVSASACVAVGSYQNSSFELVPLSESWNGTTWTMTTPPSPGGPGASSLDDVTCTSSTACLAVGSSQGEPLAESWNGTGWTLLNVPTPSGATDGAGLGAVACTSAGSCLAIGAYATSTFGSNDLFGETWNGSSWTLNTMPTPSGAQFASPTGLSCTSASDCVAIGTYQSSPSDDDVPLMETWSGASWAVTAVPTPAGSYNASLNGISCAGDGSCSVVGGSDTPAFAAFAEQRV